LTYASPFLSAEFISERVYECFYFEVCTASIRPQNIVSILNKTPKGYHYQMLRRRFTKSCWEYIFIASVKGALTAACTTPPVTDQILAISLLR
jgi:hypothetical protein